LNKQSGLKGLSGISNDLRELETAASKGDDNARLAIAVYAHRVRKYIGAYAVVMGGLDAIVITGGIGENSASMRQRILQRLDFLGLIIDENANIDAAVSHETPTWRISLAHSRVQTLVIKTNEELSIARQTLTIATNRHQVNNPSSIPIAISARHIHLTKESFAELFGKHVEPTHYKDLNQPGQYACNETLNLIGPGGRIENVRLLGPLRSKNQIEISRTDEFALGVDAPVRDSGRTKASAAITVEGPKATIQLEEGLICARRHIHMHPDDAARFGVKNKDEVEVAIRGGGARFSIL
ncbi:MAG: acetate kinase, partial [Gammaproteobacteria bacterium]